MSANSRTQQVKAAICLIQTQNSRGSGFLVSPNGHIVTNCHVIAGATQLGVRFTHDRGFRQTQILKYSVDYDLALLIASPPPGVYPLELVDASQAEGQVWHLGHPQGQLQSPEPSVTAGLVSKRGRHPQYAAGQVEMIQTSAIAKPGSSGGPVVNDDGDVIAVHVMSTQGHAGIHFSIPSNIVSQVLGVPIHHNANYQDPAEDFNIFGGFDPFQPSRNQPSRGYDPEDFNIFGGFA